MKLVAQLSFLAFVSWFAHSIGFESGIEASDAYVELKRDEFLAREARYLEDVKRISEYSPPTRDECIPAMAGFDDDILSFCSDIFAREERELHERSELDDRSPYY